MGNVIWPENLTSESKPSARPPLPAISREQVSEKMDNVHLEIEQSGAASSLTVILPSHCHHMHKNSRRNHLNFRGPGLLPISSNEGMCFTAVEEYVAPQKPPADIFQQQFSEL